MRISVRTAYLCPCRRHACTLCRVPFCVAIVAYNRRHGVSACWSFFGSVDGDACLRLFDVGHCWRRRNNCYYHDASTYHHHASINRILWRVFLFLSNVCEQKRECGAYDDMFLIRSQSTTRGHSWKLFPKHCRTKVRKHFFFCERAIAPWNCLNINSENLRSITSFNRLIKGSDLSAFLHYFK